MHLDANGATQRFVTPLACERLHYAAGRGICLEAKRGALTSYHAHLFDQQSAGFCTAMRWPVRQAAPGCRPTDGWRRRQ